MIPNELIIFDLDGVLIDSGLNHYQSLNNALSKINSKYVITYDEHVSIYNGLSTTSKLELLSINKGLNQELFNQIWFDKQSETAKFFDNIVRNDNLINFFKYIITNNIKIAVASNCIRKSVRTALTNLGVFEYVDFFISNEDVAHSKPHPEMFWKCMTELTAVPSSTIIFEDSTVGKEAAMHSGATLIPIINPSDLTIDKIYTAVNILTK